MGCTPSVVDDLHKGHTPAEHARHAGTKKMGSRHSGNSSGGCASSDQMASSRDTSDDLHESRSGRFSSGSQQQSVKPLSTGCVGAGSQILATFSHRNRLCANCDSEIRENTGGSYAHACLCIDCMYGEENALHDPTVDVPNSNLTFSRNLNSSLCPTECGSSSLFYDPCEACNRVIDDMEVVHRCDECRLFFCDDCYGEKGPAVHKHNLREFRRRMNSSVTDSSVVNKGRDREGNRLINDYVIIRVLGKGSNAKVSLVQHHRTGCFHALKILYRSRPGKGRLAFASKSTATDEDLLREIAVMRLVSHPNIVRLEEVIHDVESSKVYIIMEYCSKGPVHVHGSPPLPPEKVYKYGHGILAGLLHLHAQFLSHRDIKPANCLVNADDVVKIADFGTSGYQGHSAKVYGTPAYNCPEQFLGVHTSNEVLDSWAFAMTLYQLSHGTLPYPVHTLGGFRSQILAETPIPIDHCVGDQLEDLLHRMLEKDISKRMLASEAANHPFFFTCVERPLNLLPVADSTFDSSGEDLYERAQQMVIRGKNVGKCFHGMRSIQRMRRLLLNCEVELEGDWMTANHVGSAEVRGEGATELEIELASENKVREILNAFQEKSNKGALRLEGIPMTTPPMFVSEMAAGVTVLHFTRNRLSSVCTLSFTQFKDLRSLHITCNRLREFPVEVLSAPQLRSLDLSFNCIREVPPAIRRAGKLSALCLSHNRIERVGCDGTGNSVLSSSTMRRVILTSNPLRFLPEALETCHELELVLDDSPVLLREWEVGLHGTCTARITWNDIYPRQVYPTVPLYIASRNIKLYDLTILDTLGVHHVVLTQFESWLPLGNVKSADMREHIRDIQQEADRSADMSEEGKRESRARDTAEQKAGRPRKLSGVAMPPQILSGSAYKLIHSYFVLGCNLQDPKSGRTALNEYISTRLLLGQRVIVFFEKRYETQDMCDTVVAAICRSIMSVAEWEVTLNECYHAVLDAIRSFSE